MTGASLKLFSLDCRMLFRTASLLDGLFHVTGSLERPHRPAGSPSPALLFTRTHAPPPPGGLSTTCWPWKPAPHHLYQSNHFSNKPLLGLLPSFFRRALAAYLLCSLNTPCFYVVSKSLFASLTVGSSPQGTLPFSLYLSGCSTLLWPTVEDPIAAWHFTVKCRCFHLPLLLPTVVLPRPCVFLVIHVPSCGFTTCLYTHISASEHWKNHICFEGDISAHFPECLPSYLFWGKRCFYESLYHFTVYRFMLLVMSLQLHPFIRLPRKVATVFSRITYSN